MEGNREDSSDNISVKQEVCSDDDDTGEVADIKPDVQHLTIRLKKETSTKKCSKPKRRSYRATLAPEELARYREKDALRQRLRRAKMTQEQLDKIAEKRRKIYQVRPAETTGEERNLEREKRRKDMRESRQRIREQSGGRVGRFKLTKLETLERTRMYRQKKHLTEEQKELRNKENRQRRANMTAEEKEVYKKKRQFENLMQRIRMTPEDRAKKAEYMRNYVRNLKGERKERWKASIKKSMAKQLHNPEVYLKFLDGQKQRTANQTPEQRQRRLLGYKINQAKKKLRKDLEEIDVPEEEIHRRLELLAEEMKTQPLPPPSQYKPRPRTKKSRKLEQLEKQAKEKEITASLPRTNANLAETGENDYAEEPLFADSPPHEFHDDDLSNLDDNESADISCHKQDDNNDDDNPPETSSQTCAECHSTFYSREDLITHLILFHSEKCWKCPKCSEVMLTPQEFSEHFKSHLTQPPNLTAQTEGAQGLREMTSMTKTTHKFKCFRCDCQFESLSSLTEHVRIKHPTSCWPCAHCRLLKYSESSLLFHLKLCWKLKAKKS